MTTVKVKIEDSYVDGYLAERVIDVEAPELDADGKIDENWWEDNVFEHTGDGHFDEEDGSSVDGDSEATIIEADNPALIGKKYGWG